MRTSRWIRFSALLAAGVLLAAIAAPAAAFALTAVGGPYSESVSNPEDNRTADVTTDGGSIGVTSWLELDVPPGAVSSPTQVHATLWKVSGGKKAQDGGTVTRVFNLEPDGLVFAAPVTYYTEIPPGLSLPRAYGYDPDLDTWVPVPGGSTVVDNRVRFHTTHFSWYAIGGDPLSGTPVSSTPASSNWSLALFGLIGVGFAGIAMRRQRLT